MHLAYRNTNSTMWNILDSRTVTFADAGQKDRNTRNENACERTDNMVTKYNFAHWSDQKVWTKSKNTGNLVHDCDTRINTRESPLIRSMSTTWQTHAQKNQILARIMLTHHPTLAEKNERHVFVSCKILGTADLLLPKISFHWGKMSLWVVTL